MRARTPLRRLFGFSLLLAAGLALAGCETIGFLRITAMFDERPVTTTLNMSTAVKNPPRRMVQREDLTKR